MWNPLGQLVGAATAVPRVLLVLPRAAASPLVALQSISVSVSRLDEVAADLAVIREHLAVVDREVTAMRLGVDDLGAGVGGVVTATAPLAGELGGVRGEVGAMAADVAGLRAELEGVRLPLEAIHDTVGHLRPAAERLERLGSRFGGGRTGRLPPPA